MFLDKIITALWLSNYTEKFPVLNNNEFWHKVGIKFNHIEKSESLVVLLPAWKSSDLFLGLLNNKINKSGQSSLMYSFPPEVLCPDPDFTEEVFHEIARGVSAEIDYLKKKHNFKQIILVAPSLDAVPGAMIANWNRNIDKIYMIVPGSCLAKSLWHGIRTKKLRNIFEKNGIDLHKLEKKWKKLAPLNNIDGLNNKKICIIIAEADGIIPYKYGKELADELLNKYKNNVVVMENGFLGHYGSVIKFYLFTKSL